MYCYTGVLFVALSEGWVCTQVYLQETCSDAHERSGTNKLIWECCISYSTSIDVIFVWVPQNHRWVVSTGKNGCRFPN